MERKKYIIALFLPTLFLTGCGFFGQKTETQNSIPKEQVDLEAKKAEDLYKQANTAEASLDIASCGTISDVNVKDQCITNISLSLVGIDGNANHCDAIQDKEMKYICINKANGMKDAQEQIK